MKKSTTMLSIAILALGAGCAMFSGHPVIVDPHTVIDSGRGCPGCSGTTLRCVRPDHPKRTWSSAERALEQVIVPEVAFRDCPLTTACEDLSEQTGIRIAVAVTNRPALATITVSSEMRHQPLLFVLEMMALQQHCKLSVTKTSATFIDANEKEPNPTSEGIRQPADGLSKPSM